MWMRVRRVSCEGFGESGAMGLAAVIIGEINDGKRESVSGEFLWE